VRPVHRLHGTGAQEEDHLRQDAGRGRRELASALSDRESGLTFDTGSLVLADYLDRWLEDSVRDSVKQRTFENYAYVVRLHLAPTLGHMKLKALSPAHVQGLYPQSSIRGCRGARCSSYIPPYTKPSSRQCAGDSCPET
jgi:hypothetical protein